jgi:RHS repeat-associated protein
MNYVGNYEKEVIEGGETNEYDYIYSPEGLAAIAVKTGSTRTLYYAHLDHLGSLRVLTADNKSITSRYHYDAWGLRTLVAGANITNRGFTGHEHLPEFGFINMNARLYDPVIGRFLAMDPYVQMPDYTQAFNRYSYSMNNPLIYTDPSGEKWWHWLLGDVLTGGLFSSSALITSSVVAGTVAGTGAAVYATTFPFSNDFYELQKFISPIAIKPPSFHFGSDQTGFGFDISAGFPTSAAPGARYHFGATYHINSYGGYQGWETRSGLETRMLPLVSYSYTKFRAGEFTQTTGMFRTGPPFAQLSYENDYMFFFWGADKGDRWRTAAVQMNAGLFSFYLNMFTGDPDSFSIGDRERNVKMINGHLTYTGGSADKYRAGVLSLGFGPIRVGRNSEEIRKVFQNQFAHDILTGGDAKWFRVLDIMPRWYWYFGFGTGNSLW